MAGFAPTLPAARGSLRPEGAFASWGGPASLMAGSAGPDGIGLNPRQCQRIAGVAQRLDAVQRLELLAQAADHDVHRAGEKLGLVAAQLVQDVVTAEHLSGLTRQQVQQVKFGASQLDGFTLALYAARGGVDTQSVKCEGR